MMPSDEDFKILIERIKEYVAEHKCRWKYADYTPEIFIECVKTGYDTGFLIEIVNPFDRFIAIRRQEYQPEDYVGIYFKSDLEDMPLHLDKEGLPYLIVKWRLEIGK